MLRVHNKTYILLYPKCQGNYVQELLFTGRKVIKEDEITERIETDLNTGSIHEAELVGLCFATEDKKEGMTAFLEKRKAVFTDK
jgi:1,4-dihydroxy-2-naphthoyl-CoA synthase